MATASSTSRHCAARRARRYCALLDSDGAGRPLLWTVRVLDDAEIAARLAPTLPSPAVVVTLGADGALVVDRGVATHVPAPPVTPVDTTAAGDSFCGALADALVRGETLIDATQWAVRVGAATTQRPGAQPSLPTPAEVEQLLG